MVRSVAVLLIAAFGTSCAADEFVAVTGCVEKESAEIGCIFLRTPDGKAFNINASKPKPELGAWGEITGTLKNDESTPCAHHAVISPAEWKERGDRCPSRKPE